ncbi:MAG: ribonuclease PH [Planctomycetota bacterium]
MSAEAAPHIRPTKIERGVNGHAEGSALITSGRTRVLVTASVLPQVPGWLAGTGSGWITAEYGMLPRATNSRKPRPETRTKPDGRSLEIQRLVGRSLRQAVEVGYLKSHSIYVDCDVLEADGGTRVASVNAGAVALFEALVWMKRKRIVPGVPTKGLVAAMSVAWSGGAAVLDPDYQADSSAEADMNTVFAESGDIVELQITGEKAAVPEERLVEMVRLARGGAVEMLGLIREALGEELVAEAGLAAD